MTIINASDKSNPIFTASQPGGTVGEGSRIFTGDGNLAIGKIITTPRKVNGGRECYFIDMRGEVHRIIIKGTMIDGKASKGVDIRSTGIRYESDKYSTLGISKERVDVESKDGKYFACSTTPVSRGDKRPDGVAFMDKKGAVAFEYEASRGNWGTIHWRSDGNKLSIQVGGKNYEIENSLDNLKHLNSVMNRYGARTESLFAAQTRIMIAQKSGDLSTYGINDSLRIALVSKDANVRNRALHTLATAMDKLSSDLRRMMTGGYPTKEVQKFILNVEKQLIYTLGYSKENVNKMLTRLMNKAVQWCKDDIAGNRVLQGNEFTVIDSVEAGNSIDIAKQNISMIENSLAKPRGIKITTAPQPSWTELLPSLFHTAKRSVSREEMDPRLTSDNKIMKRYEQNSTRNIAKYERSLSTPQGQKMAYIHILSSYHIKPENISGMKNIRVIPIYYMESKPITDAKTGTTRADTGEYFLLQGEREDGKLCLIDPSSGQFFPGDSDTDIDGAMKKFSENGCPAFSEGSKITYRSKDGSLKPLDIKRSNIQLGFDAAKAIGTATGSVLLLSRGHAGAAAKVLFLTTVFEAGHLAYKGSQGLHVSSEEVAGLAIQFAMMSGGIAGKALMKGRSITEVKKIVRFGYQTCKALEIGGFTAMGFQMSEQALDGMIRKDPSKALSVMKDLVFMAAIHKLNSRPLTHKEYRKALNGLSPETKNKVFAEEGGKVPRRSDKRFQSDKEYMEYLQKKSNQALREVEIRAMETKVIDEPLQLGRTESVFVKETNATTGKTSYKQIDQNMKYANKTPAELNEMMRKDPTVRNDVQKTLNEGKVVILENGCIVPKSTLNVVHTHPKKLSARELDSIRKADPATQSKQIKETLGVSEADIAQASKNKGKIEILLPTEDGRVVSVSIKFKYAKGEKKIASLMVRDVYSVQGGRTYAMSEDQLAKLDPEIRNNVPSRFLDDAHTTLNDSTILYTKGTSQIAVKFNKNGEIVDIISIRGKSAGAKPLEKNPLERRDMTPQNDLRDFIDFLNDKGIKNVQPKDFVAHGNENSKTMGWRLEPKKLKPINEQIVLEETPPKAAEVKPPIKPKAEETFDHIKDDTEIFAYRKATDPSTKKITLIRQSIGTIADLKNNPKYKGEIKDMNKAGDIYKKIRDIIQAEYRTRQAEWFDVSEDPLFGINFKD